MIGPGSDKNEILKFMEKCLHNIHIIEQIWDTLLSVLLTPQYKWFSEVLSHLKRRHQKSSCERFSSFVLAGFPGSRHQSLSIQLPPCALVVHSNNVTINGTIHVESETYFWNLIVWKPLHCEAHQSHKNPVSASAMLTGKFLQIRKVFATSSLLAEEFPDTLQYKISR